MIALLQRASQASVVVDGQTLGSIGRFADTTKPLQQGSLNLQNYLCEFWRHELAGDAGHGLPAEFDARIQFRDLASALQPVTLEAVAYESHADENDQPSRQQTANE